MQVNTATISILLNELDKGTQNNSETECCIIAKLIIYIISRIILITETDTLLQTFGNPRAVL